MLQNGTRMASSCLFNIESAFVQCALFVLCLSWTATVHAARIPHSVHESLGPSTHSLGTIDVLTAAQLESYISTIARYSDSSSGSRSSVRSLTDAAAAPQPFDLIPPDPETLLADLISSATAADVQLPPPGKEPLRVMIVGDSMTQGLQGDWTWRYRIWQWFQQNNIDVQFVGPYNGTVEPDEPSKPQPPPLYGHPPENQPPKVNGGYARGVDEAFLSNNHHFSVWGRAAAVDKGLIRHVVDKYEADLMLLMLGFNDLGWWYSDPRGTIDSIATLVDHAREANPELKFAVANIPFRTEMGGRPDLAASTKLYNALLQQAIPLWSSDKSPIHLVNLAERYDCGPRKCPAGYDGLHPNAWGDFLIARAFSETLWEDFSLGQGTLDVPHWNDPSLERDLPTPGNFQVFSSPQGVTATWDAVYGAYGYDLEVSINGGSNGFSGERTGSNRWDSHWPIEGWTYSISVRATAGDDVQSEYTAPKSADAKPKLAPAPETIRVHAAESGLNITWDPPESNPGSTIIEYNVIFWDWLPEHCQGPSSAAFKSSPAVIEGLNPGTNYFVAIMTWNNHGEGLPHIAANAVPGAGTPSVPSEVLVRPMGAISAHITWKGSQMAGGYKIWSRRLHQAEGDFEVIATVTDGTCSEQYFLFPSVWDYVFAVSAFNGDDESARSPEAVASSMSIDPDNFGCPSPGPWCPRHNNFSPLSGVWVDSTADTPEPAHQFQLGGSSHPSEDEL